MLGLKLFTKTVLFFLLNILTCLDAFDQTFTQMDTMIRLHKLDHLLLLFLKQDAIN